MRGLSFWLVLTFQDRTGRKIAHNVVYPCRSSAPTDANLYASCENNAPEILLMIAIKWFKARHFHFCSSIYVGALLLKMVKLLCKWKKIKKLELFHLDKIYMAEKFSHSTNYHTRIVKENFVVASNVCSISIKNL